MKRADRRVLGAIVLVSALAFTVQLPLGLGSATVFALPVLALLVPLVAGRYPGEERIARLARAVGRRLRGPAPRPLSPPALRTSGILPRGGRLIASRLAARPPPAPAF